MFLCIFLLCLCVCVSAHHQALGMITTTTGCRLPIPFVSLFANVASLACSMSPPASIKSGHQVRPDPKPIPASILSHRPAGLGKHCPTRLSSLIYTLNYTHTHTDTISTVSISLSLSLQLAVNISLSFRQCKSVIIVFCVCEILSVS